MYAKDITKKNSCFKRYSIPLERQNMMQEHPERKWKTFADINQDECGEETKTDLEDFSWYSGDKASKTFFRLVNTSR
jgi:hypothetical protein